MIEIEFAEYVIQRMTIHVAVEDLIIEIALDFCALEYLFESFKALKSAPLNRVITVGIDLVNLDIHCFFTFLGNGLLIIVFGDTNTKSR